MWKSESNQSAPTGSVPCVPPCILQHATATQRSMLFAVLCFLPSMALWGGERRLVRRGSGGQQVNDRVNDLPTRPSPRATRRPATYHAPTGHLKGTCAIHPGAPARVNTIAQDRCDRQPDPLVPRGLRRRLPRVPPHVEHTGQGAHSVGRGRAFPAQPEPKVGARWLPQARLPES